MIIRIQFGMGPRVRRHRGTNRYLALTVAAMLTPATVLACVLALWRIAADLNWTKQFAIASGLFSHWQVWMVAATVLQMCAYFLDRYGRGQERAASVGAARIETSATSAPPERAAAAQKR